MRFLMMLAVLVSLAFHSSVAFAQSAAPTSNILSRISMVESRYGRGSIFSIDVDNREYWITAKHILTGAEHPPYGSVETKTASLSILDPSAPGERWLPENFKVIDPGKDIDIVVLAASEPLLSHPIASLPADSSGVMLGGDCEFLGFPYGGGWQTKFASGGSIWMPFVKHCTISALMQGEDEQIFVLDGINNEGFSGGPVVVGTGQQQKIIAVISGYHTEPAEIIASISGERPLKSSQTKKPVAMVNSGFIIAFSIHYAITAIQKDPVGPLRKTD